MRRAFLLAYPASHSLSPAMHNAAFAHLGADASYRALEVPPDGLDAAVASLRRPQVLGANVTIPHKVAVTPLLDWLSPAAQALGAVNTVVQGQGGRLEGHNTDVRGFLRGLADLNLEPSSQRALILGAGGAARAVAYALLAAGVAELALHNRTQTRARALAERLGSAGTVSVVERHALRHALETTTLLVNTTSVGMVGGASADLSPLPTGLLPRVGTVIDIVYRPPQTRLLQEAAAAGLATQNGIPMLLYQGVEALELWLGKPAPVTVMRAALLAALAA